jgi:hypothetical protein
LHGSSLFGANKAREKQFLMQFDDLCRKTDIFSLNFVASKVYEKYKLFEEKIKK